MARDSRFSTEIAVKSATVEIGGLAPTFSLIGADGGTHDLATFRGRTVLLVFYRGHW